MSGEVGQLVTSKTEMRQKLEDLWVVKDEALKVSENFICDLHKVHQQPQSCNLFQFGWSGESGNVGVRL